MAKRIKSFPFFSWKRSRVNSPFDFSVITVAALYWLWTQTLIHLCYTWGLLSRLCFCYVLLSWLFCLSLYSWEQCVHPPLSVSHYRSIETSSQVTHKELNLRAFSPPLSTCVFPSFFRGVFTVSDHHNLREYLANPSHTDKLSTHTLQPL